jgi:hypothetical protein
MSILSYFGWFEILLVSAAIFLIWATWDFGES